MSGPGTPADTGPEASGPTPQGLGAQGPGNAHGVPAGHEPDTEGQPFDPAGGQPAKDPEAAAKALLDRANPGPAASEQVGPDVAGAGKPAG